MTQTCKNIFHSDWITMASEFGILFFFLRCLPFSTAGPGISVRKWKNKAEHRRNGNNCTFTWSRRARGIGCAEEDWVLKGKLTSYLQIWLIFYPASFQAFSPSLQQPISLLMTSRQIPWFNFPQALSSKFFTRMNPESTEFGAKLTWWATTHPAQCLSFPHKAAKLKASLWCGGSCCCIDSSPEPNEDKYVSYFNHVFKATDQQCPVKLRDRPTFICKVRWCREKYLNNPHNQSDSKHTLIHKHWRIQSNNILQRRLRTFVNRFLI